MKLDPEFVKYPEIPHLIENLDILDSDCLEVYEKLDGGNSQIRIYDGKIFTGSRANFLNREENFKFEWFKDFNKWAKSNYSLYNLPENLIIFGEFLSPHTLKYKPEFENKFFFIDLYDLNQKKFIQYEVAKSGLEKDIGIEKILFLKSLANGKLDLSAIKDLAIYKSQYSDYGKEGVVIKDYHHQNFAKLWRTSANPTKEGLIEEINKTILSLRYTGLPIQSRNLSLVVYNELRRSGRKEISLAQIKDTITKVLTK